MVTISFVNLQNPLAKGSKVVQFSINEKTIALTFVDGVCEVDDIDVKVFEKNYGSMFNVEFDSSYLDSQYERSYPSFKDSVKSKDAKKESKDDEKKLEEKPERKKIRKRKKS